MCSYNLPFLASFTLLFELNNTVVPSDFTDLVECYSSISLWSSSFSNAL